MYLHIAPRLICLLALCLLTAPAVTVAAQHDDNDLYWRQFDERFPEIAGKGEVLCQKAGEIAALQVDQSDEEAYASRQNLIFQALAVNERDHAIMRKKAKTKAEHEWILSRRDAAKQFEADVETLKALRTKADSELTQSDLTQLLEASVSLMQYIYESQIQANESYLDTVVQENQTLRKQLAEAKRLAEAEKQPAEVQPEPETQSDPKGNSRKANKNDFRIYLQTDRIRIGGQGLGNEYDRNRVQITGAIKNQTDKPARFRFQIIARRSNRQAVGLKTIETPIIPPGGVHEIDARMAVEHSAYVRNVDMRSVQIIEP